MYMKQVMALLSFVVSTAAFASTITLYTDRPTARLQPIADQFKQQTGHDVVIVELPYKDLLTRLKAEGEGSPADLIFTKDIVYQTELANLGFFQPMKSDRVTSTVHASMRDPQNLWTAVTYRARTLVYDPAKTDVSQIEDYADLANEKWAGRLCLRTFNNSYNESLVSAFIQNYGYDKAKEIVAGYVANLATDVFKNGDTAVIEAVANGTCDVALVNHYYLAQTLAQKPNLPVRVKFLNQNSTGVHVNGSGIGVAKTSKQVAAATAFIDLLMTDSVQESLSAAHFDYPASQKVVPTSLIKDWGTFKFDLSNWTAIGSQLENARKLAQEVDYN